MMQVPVPQQRSSSTISHSKNQGIGSPAGEHYRTGCETPLIPRVDLAATTQLAGIAGLKAVARAWDGRSVKA
jgi:hypothetical protein